MRIAFFTENYARGGLDTFLISLFNNWPNCDDELVLICNQSHPGIQDIRDRVTRPLEIISHDVFSYMVASHWPILNKCPKIIRRLVLFSLLIGLYPYEKRGFKKILSRCNADRLMVVNGGYPAGYTCLIANIVWSEISDKPKAWHNFHNYAMTAHPLLRLWGGVLDRAMARSAAGFVTVSTGCAKSLAVRDDLKQQPVQVIYNGIAQPAPDNSTDIRQELGIAQDTPLCLMLGTYEPRKGHRFLFQAFARVAEVLPEAHLLICGDSSPDEYAEVERLRQEIAPSANIHLRGFRTDATNLISQVNLLVVASQEFESFGLTSVEAMALGVPVVATDVGGVPEVVVNDDGGYCVSRHDGESYSKKMLLLLLDPELAKAQGEKGKARFQRLFESTTMAQQYYQLICHNQLPELSHG